ncbi:MAG: hypothetical protein KJ737_23540 [Proteobacteria bacterium]|nr:hypothetical protein [Pseudomonadota bacterium]
MEHEISNLMESLTLFMDMQEAHLKAFDTELMPDIKKQNFERSQAFEDLKNMLNQEMKTIKDNESHLGLAKQYSEQISSILSVETLLKERILIYKEELQSHMKQIQNGKKAMKGYGQLGAVHAPKVMSKSG